MKKMHRGSFVIAGLLMALSVTLFSFKTGKGGDSFTIHLNNKLVLQQHLYGDKTVKSLTLQASNSNDELRISFSHCGKVGKSRMLTIKDQNNKLLKQWRFEDTNGSMTCKVKDILGLEKGNTTLQLFYSSAEMPKGHVLVSIVAENRSTVKN
jgi:hypothetical protein